MASPDKKLMQKGWTDSHFERVREAYNRMENFIESEVTPYISLKKHNKCQKAKKQHSYIVIEKDYYKFAEVTIIKSKCEVCKKKKTDIIKDRK